MRTLRLSLLWLVLHGASLAQPGLPALPEEVRLGQSPQRIRALLGPPARISQQVLLLRSIEQWHYGVPHQVRLTFECPRGQKPTLTVIRRLGPQPR